MKYGAILPLMRAKPNELNYYEKGVVQNYKYCL